MTEQNKESPTPLMLAAANGNAFEVATLLAEGADPSVQDKFGMTAKQKAEERGFPEIAALLDTNDKTITEFDETVNAIKDDDVTVPELNINFPASKPLEAKIKNENLNQNSKTNVALTSIKIPFFSMVGIMLKWLSATIIASTLIASIVYLILFIISKYIL